MHKDLQVRKEYNRQWKLKNPEKVKEAQKQYRLKNSEKVKEKDKQYRLKNSEMLKEKSKQWRLKNPEKMKELTKQWYKENSERAKETNKQWHDKNREKTKSNSRKRRLKQYGLTLEQYKEKLTEQLSGCSICGDTIMQTGKILCVDHNHSTKKIRDLICRGCNIMLGYANDDPERLRKGADYLDRHNNEVYPIEYNI